jgi:transposase, IS5 family
MCQEAWRVVFGYKLSANADKCYKLIRKLKVSSASEHDNNHFEDVLDPANTSRAVLADRASSMSSARRG